MMTNSKKVSTWKYFLTLPAIALCFGLMSARAGSDQRIRKDNITTFRGNTLEWETGVGNVYEVIDPMTFQYAPQTINHEDRILKVNGHAVTPAIREKRGSKFEFSNPVLAELAVTVENALRQRKGQLPENIGYIQIHNLVVDKDLNVYYYDVRTGGSDVKDTTLAGLNKITEVNKVIDEILNDKKLINPGNRKLDRDYYTLMIATAFVPIAFRVKQNNP